WTWGVFGFHEPLGRILSGLFSLLLLGALVQLLRGRDWGGLAAALGVLALVSMPVYAAQVVSGLTDIPVAALVALAGAPVWRRRRRSGGPAPELARAMARRAPLGRDRGGAALHRLGAGCCRHRPVPLRRDVRVSQRGR